jgi:glycosyltransferase involved in cell wall biosynthesis
MSVLLVTHYYAGHRGGVERIAEEVAGRLSRAGLPVEWAASAPCDTRLPDGVKALPMTACNITERRLGIPYPVWGPISLLRLCVAVRRSKLVHLHDCLYFGNVVAFLLARVFGKPVVVTQHIGLVPYSSRLLRGLMTLANAILARIVLRGASACVFYSERVLLYFLERTSFRRMPLWIENGVSPELFSPLSPSERQRLRAKLRLPADKPIMLFVGRFVEKKGLSILRKLAQQFTRCAWVFVGWGPDDPQRWDVPNVYCPGSLGQKELAQYYQASHLLVLPSVGEGFPLVVQEAMACGTPVLISEETASGQPGIEQVAFISDLRNNAIAVRLGAILDDATTLERRRRDVADYARQHWNWETCAARYHQLFAELIGDTSNTPTAAEPMRQSGPFLIPATSALNPVQSKASAGE